tara:strand:+ start:1138 stop:1380 length:243 start_codon:yes stop_codon:yes gene_type:complete
MHQAPDEKFRALGAGGDSSMSGEMQSILSILGDLQAKNAEMRGRMVRLEAVMLKISSKVDSIEVKVNALDWKALTWRRLD